MPSKKTLSEICKNRKDIVPVYYTFPKNLPEDKLAIMLGASAFGLKTFVNIFYYLGTNPDKDFNSLYLLDVFQEGFKNVLAHSIDNTENFDYGLFLGDKGICQGFRDFGNYFKSQKIKRIWENKMPISSSKKTPFSGKGTGNKFIYKATDSIEVDAKEGILYCVQSHEKLDIIPEKAIKK